MGRRRHRAVSVVVRALVEQLESRTLLAAAGPDGYGYVADPVAFENIELTPDGAGVVTVIEAADDTEAAIDLGDNTFTFYGVTYTGGDIAINSNGLITFADSTSSFSNDDLTGLSLRCVAALWDDWISPAQVLTKLEDTGGTAAADRLIIQWRGERYPSSPHTVTFQSILQLNTGSAQGTITLNYPDTDSGDSESTDGFGATVGIKDFGTVATNRLLISHPDTPSSLIASGKAVRISNTATGHPHADAGEDKDVIEGETVVLSGSASSDPDQSSASLAYAWDLDGDGVFGESGEDASNGNESGVQVAFAGNISTGEAFAVALRVTDNSGLVSFDTADVNITNLPPTVAIAGPDTAVEDVPGTWTLTANDASGSGGGSFFDIFVDWGDGTEGDSYSDDGAGIPVSHIYRDTGAYTITVTASDGLGGTSDPVTKQVTVAPRPDAELIGGILIVTTGDGDDQITVDVTGSNIRLNRNGTVTTYSLAGAPSIDIQSGGGDDVITADVAVAQTINAGAGNDTIISGGSHANILGDEGDDAMTGTIGNDSIDGGEGNNSIDARAGFDTIHTGDGNDTVTAGESFDEIDTRGGDDEVHLHSGSVFLGAGDDTLTGGIADDGIIATGDAGNDSITTGDGADNISDAAGDDTIDTGGGNDRIDCADGDDDITAGDGDDVIIAFGGGTTVNAGDGNDTVAASGVESVFGGNDDDVIMNLLPTGPIDAGGGDDLVRVLSDADHPGIVHGGDGDDDLFTSAGRDTIFGGAGNDTVHSGDASDRIVGGGGNDKLFGQGGNDRLYGGAGADRLEGQGGNDRFTGGAGADFIRGGDGDNSVLDDDPLDILDGVA